MKTALKRFGLIILIEILAFVLCLPILCLLIYYAKPSDPIYIKISMFILICYGYYICNKFGRYLYLKFNINIKNN